MQQTLRSERGMALAMAIFALVVVGALVGGAFFLGTQEQRVGENQHRLGQSFGIAEAGAPELIRNWSPDSFNVLRVFPADTYKLGTRTTAANTGAYGGSIWKLNRNLYLFDVTGSDAATRGTGGAAFRRRGGGAQQRIGMIMRIRPLNLPMRGALMTRGTTGLAGNVTVDGADRTPNASWTSCAPPDTNKAGIYTSGTVNPSGVQYTLSGSPPVQQDPSINASSFDTFGDVSYAQLASMANKVYNGNFSSNKLQPAVSGGACNKTDPDNWGDGINRGGGCGAYFPIIHVKGDFSAQNYQGQGVLLVDGNANVSGSFQFYGVTIIKGTLGTSGGGISPAHFFGSVMVQNQNNASNAISGSAKILYSKCAVVEALQWTGLGAQLRSRSWVAMPGS